MVSDDVSKNLRGGCGALEEAASGVILVPHFPVSREDERKGVTSKCYRNNRDDCIPWQRPHLSGSMATRSSLRMLLFRLPHSFSCSEAYSWYHSNDNTRIAIVEKLLLCFCDSKKSSCTKHHPASRGSPSPRPQTSATNSRASPYQVNGTRASVTHSTKGTP